MRCTIRERAFCRALDTIEEHLQFEDEVNALLHIFQRDGSGAVSNIFSDTKMIDSMVDILAEHFGENTQDTEDVISWIDWFICDTEFGHKRDLTRVRVTEDDGSETIFNIICPEDLYDFLTQL